MQSQVSASMEPAQWTTAVMCPQAGLSTGSKVGQLGGQVCCSQADTAYACKACSVCTDSMQRVREDFAACA